MGVADVGGRQRETQLSGENERSVHDVSACVWTVRVLKECAQTSVGAGRDRKPLVETVINILVIRTH